MFIFDNSQNHHSKSPYALFVNALNLKDGSKNERLMRNGWFIDDNGQRVVQTLYPNTLEVSKPILAKRGSWPEQCFSRDAARKMISSPPDFMSQMEWLDETITEAGFIIDFYPKYHFEFNCIEIIWGATKSYHEPIVPITSMISLKQYLSLLKALHFLRFEILPENPTDILMYIAYVGVMVIP